MSVIPALVVQAVLELVEESGQPVHIRAFPAWVRVERRREHARGAGMGDDAVDLPADLVELCPRGIEFALVRELLRPPAGIRHAVFPVHARGTAHGEDCRTVELKDLAARQAPNRRSIRQALRQPAVPRFHGTLLPVVEALVVAVDEQHRVGARLQPGDVGAFLGREVPWKAKVTGDDEVVVARQTIPKLPVAELLHVKPTVDVACHISRHRIAASLLYAASSRSTCLSPVSLTHQGHFTRPHGSSTPANHSFSSSRLTGECPLASQPTS